MSRGIEEILKDGAVDKDECLEMRGYGEVDTITMDEVIEVDVGLLEMLLNSIANLKYINEVAPETQKAWLEVVDAKWDEGMKVLSEHRHKESA